jgi:hypothetical protein
MKIIEKQKLSWTALQKIEKEKKRLFMIRLIKQQQQISNMGNRIFNINN